MGQADKKTEVATPSKRYTKWIVGGIFLVVFALIAMNLPRGYNDDLSLIGKGQPTIVLVRDKNIVQSFDLLNVLDNIRHQYSGRINFLLTDFDTPQGQLFVQANQAARATLVLLDSNGKLVKVLSAPQTEESVRQEIATSFGEKQ